MERARRVCAGEAVDAAYRVVIAMLPARPLYVPQQRIAFAQQMLATGAQKLDVL